MCINEQISRPSTGILLQESFDESGKCEFELTILRHSIDHIMFAQRFSFISVNEFRKPLKFIKKSS